MRPTYQIEHIDIIIMTLACIPVGHIDAMLELVGDRLHAAQLVMW
jgi:hypothetical protein